MAFVSTVDGEIQYGGRRITYGTFTSSAGSTGGDVTTGLIHIEGFQITPFGSGVATNEWVVDDTFPLYTDGVEITTDANGVGFWQAQGY